MNDLATAIVTIIGAIITVALVSVLVSPKAQTAQALNATGGFLSRVIAAAVDPASTASTNGNPARNAFSMPLPDFGGGLAALGSGIVLH